MSIKSALFYVLFITIPVSCYSQKMISVVDDSTTHRVINSLLLNRETAKFPYIHKELSIKSKVVKVFSAAVMTNDKASTTYNYDFISNVKVDGSEFLVYNLTPHEDFEILGTFSDDDSNDLHMYPALSIKESFLEDVKRYYNIDSVVFLALYGIPGYCIMVNNEIWIIDGNERTDLKTYLKEYYPTLPLLRNLFLLKNREN